MISDTTSTGQVGSVPSTEYDFPDPPRDAAAWAARADELAEWTLEHLVNRKDVWGAYWPFHLRDERGKIWTAPGRAKRGKVYLTPAVLDRHYRGQDVGHLIGLHSTSADNTSISGAADIDLHEGSQVTAEANQTAAIGWYDRLATIGFSPLLTSSNGMGGFHECVLFREPVPTPRVFAFLLWLVSDYATRGLTAAPETFPKQAQINPGQYGNWLRLPGRHHSREHWSQVWNGQHWLDGEEAVQHILSLKGDSPDLIPAEAQEHEPPKVRITVRFVPAHQRHFGRGGNLDQRIRAYMGKLPHRSAGQKRDDIAYCFAAWLVRDLELADEVALPYLEEWDRGNNPPKGTDRLREIIASAHQYGKHAVGCAREGR